MKIPDMNNRNGPQTSMLVALVVVALAVVIGLVSLIENHLTQQDAALLSSKPNTSAELSEQTGAAFDTRNAPWQVIVHARQTQEDFRFIDELLPKISRWDVDVLKPYLASATGSSANLDDIESVLEVLSGRLGELRFYDSPQRIEPAASVDAIPHENLAQYHILAMYESSAADINLVLTRESTGRALYSIDIQVLDTSNVLSAYLAHAVRRENRTSTTKGVI